MNWSEWRWITDPPRPGAENMQIDEALLQQVENERRETTIVRFYQWAQPAVSLGRHQRPEEAIELSFCRGHSIPVVHRPTGGRAVFHARELTYAVVSNDPEEFPLHSIHQTYFKIAAALQKGFETLSIPVALAASTREASTAPLPSWKPPCFVSVSRYELLSRGRKIAGSAQRRLKRSFLQQGSIPLEIDYPLMAAVLGVAESLLRRTVISVSEAAGRTVSYPSLCEALGAGFQATFPSPQRCSDQAGML